MTQDTIDARQIDVSINYARQNNKSRLEEVLSAESKSASEKWLGRAHELAKTITEGDLTSGAGGKWNDWFTGKMQEVITKKINALSEKLKSDHQKRDPSYALVYETLNLLDPVIQSFDKNNPQNRLFIRTSARIDNADQGVIYQFDPELNPRVSLQDSTESGIVVFGQYKFSRDALEKTIKEDPSSHAITYLEKGVYLTLDSLILHGGSVSLEPVVTQLTYDQFDYLKQLINQPQQNRTKPAETPRPQIKIENKVNNEWQAEPQDLSIEVSAISRSASLNVLRKAEIHANEYQGKHLTTDILEQQSLAPTHRFRDKNSPVEWYSSNPYSIGSGRIAVVAYVSVPDLSDQYKQKIVARTYYRSNSQGLWRYLPSYKEKFGQIAWYDKGRGEESITLPTAIQKALSELPSQPQDLVKVDNPNLVFAGTARKIDSDDNTYRREVDEVAYPLRLDGEVKQGKQKIAPDMLGAKDSQDGPDFSEVKDTWSAETSLTGLTQYEVYQSKNSKFNYIFCKGQSGQVWVGGIEVRTSPVASTGLRKMWVKAGDLTTPAYEYLIDKTDQTGGYGNIQDRKGESGEYVDMTKNYLNKIPIIQEYRITSATSFETLFAELTQLGTFSDQGSEVQVQDIKKLINQIRSKPGGRTLLGSLPQSNGLRNKVLSLLSR